MKKSLLRLTGLCIVLLSFCACSDDNEAYNPYDNWQARNAEEFSRVVGTARTAIAEAKATYGDNWEEHCEWRMFKSYHKPPFVAGATTDSICVRIDKSGTGKGCPTYSDSVRVDYRGYLIPAQYEENGELVSREEVFSQSFYGELNTDIAAPALFAVAGTVYGFSTALQYMHVGDRWWVYMPSELAYGSTASGTVPAFSMLKYYIHLVDYYTPGSGVPDWK